MDCPPGRKEVAVVERWPLVEVRLSTVCEQKSLIVI